MRDLRLKDAALLAAALGFVLFSVAPLAWMTLGAFKTTAGIMAIPPAWPDFSYFENFRNVLRDNASFLLNSIVVTLGATALAMLFAVPTAFGLVNFKIRGANALADWILGTRMMPPLAAVVLLFVIFRSIGLLENILALIIAYAGFNIPFAVWVSMSFLRRVPRRCSNRPAWTAAPGSRGIVPCRRCLGPCPGPRQRFSPFGKAGAKTGVSGWGPGFRKEAPHLTELRIDTTMPLMNLACRGCGARAVRLFLDLGEQPHCNRLVPPGMADRREPVFPLRVGFCEDCTLVQIDHTVPKESLFSDYPYVSGTTKTLVAHFKETAERLVRTHDLAPGALVVDIGSNDGTWLKQYQPLGLRVLGVDPAANVVDLAIKSGVPTWARFFDETVADEILQHEGAPALVTAAGVFFHLEELHSVVRGVAKLIGEDGVFVVQAIYLGGMLENLAFDQIYHEHLVYYTLWSIGALLARHGLEVFEARLVPIHGGSLEVHVAKAGRRPQGESVAAMRADEEARGYGRFETYHRFGERVWVLRDEVLAVLDRYRDQGKSVYAYGAPAKGATLLNSFGITTDRVQKAEEKNPMKVGSLMPGSRIPIVAEGGGRPDAYLVLAWNFFDEFVAKEGDYLDRGGEFIVPVPRLRIVGRTQDR